MALSPDGTRVAYKLGFGLWVHDLRDDTRVRLTEAERDDSALPVWDFDGTRIFFTSNRDGNWDVFVRTDSCLEQLSRKLILQFLPIVRTGTPPGAIINFVFVAVMVVGLALSLWRRGPRSPQI